MPNNTTANPYAKMRPNNNPYAVYQDDRLPGWEWKILKMYQRPDKAKTNPYASAFCAVTSPLAGPMGDMGDTYLNDIGRVHVSGPDILAECGRFTKKVRA